MVLCHMTIKYVPRFKNLVTNLTLVPIGQFMLRLQVSFHVVSFHSCVGLHRGAEGAEVFAISRPHSVGLHEV